MRQWLPQRRIARSLVALIAVGLFEVASPSAQAAVLTAPTINSVTVGNGTLTVNMSVEGNPGNFWTYNVTRRVTSGCANPYTDGANTNTASLSTTIRLTGLTNGCTYIVRVASNLDGVGNFAEIDGMPSNYGNFLDLVWANDGGSGAAGINRTPISSGCHSETVTALNYTIAGSTRPGGTCNTSFFTGYYSGYIRAPFTGSVNFKLSGVDDSAVLALQGNTILTAQNNTTNVTISMISGQVYRFELWFHNDSVGATYAVTWNYNGSGDIAIPSSALANDPSVLSSDNGCSLGMAARCAAGSALEIKQATGTNIDGQYWINIGGTPTLVYCIMNSSQGGGGWMLAMRGKNDQSTFKYTSSLWVNNTLTGTTSYPERYSSSDSFRNTDAKYAPFTSMNSNQLMVLFPDYTNNGGRYSATNKSPILNANYGFSWAETYTTTGSSIAPWTAYNASTGWGGNSWNVAQANGPAEKTNDPTSTPSCVSGPTSLTNLFLNANRCAFRRVGSTYAVDSSSSYPYSAIGDGLFYTQTNIGFFGINYASASTSSQRYRARIGFGWNENGNGDEGSNDGTAGIGLDNANQTTQAAGTHNQCCYTQLGTGTGVNVHMAFEVYVRNSQPANVSGQATVRITAGRTSSTTIAQSYTQSVTTGSATYRLTPQRPGFSLDPSTGTLKVSGGLAPGTYFETVTATDGNGASGALGVTINVVADSSETDTALSFNGSSQYEMSTQTWTNSGDFTISMWVRPDSNCSASGNQTAFVFVNTMFFCRSGIWYSSINSSGSTWVASRITSVRANEWVHLALTRSGTTMRAYVNNVNVSAQTNSVWEQSWTQSSIAGTSGNVYLGGTGSAGQYFNGALDEVKVFNTARSASTIWANANVQESVNNVNLLVYYDFNETSGSAINRAQGATSTSDINLSDSNSPARTSIISVTPDGPYTDVTVPRSIITSAGGWKVPDSVIAVTVNIVGGGGGGGGGYQGGGGGGGGFIERTVSVTPKSIYPIQVGVGGRGLFSPGSGPVLFPTNGETSSAFSLSAAGGGAGGVEIYASNVYQEVSAKSGGSGGGGNWGTFFNGGSGIAGQGNAGGYSKRLENGYNGCTANNYVGAGGGGAGSVGADATCSKGGNGGAGKVAIVTGNYLAGGGGGSHRSATTTAEQGSGGLGGGGSSAYVSGAENDSLGGASSGEANTGGGGGAGLHPMGTSGYGGNGGLGIVTFRYITALKPTYTKPTNAYLNVGMTETFTTNVVQDSATAVLTRTFRWESTTTGSNGTFTLIKQGTGAANAAFSWVPPDTRTSGSNYLYRLIVTDSDTAGLFITDSSTAFAVINPALSVSGTSTIAKRINLGKSETFTITLGTSTYNSSLSPTIPGISLDTSTAGLAVIKISETMTVGTYYETLTVIDSVSASVVTPLIIHVAAPPTLLNTGEIVANDLILNLDAGNSESLISGDTTTVTSAIWKDLSGNGKNAQTTGTNSFNGFSCAAPTYYRDFGGYLDFNGTNQCFWVPYLGTNLYNSMSVEAWFRVPGTSIGAGVALMGQAYPTTSRNIDFSLGSASNTATDFRFGVFRGSNTTWVGTDGYTPNANTANTWTHMVGTYDGSNFKLYVNGVLVDTTYNTASTSAAAEWQNKSGYFIGRRYDGSNYFNGSIASIRVYDIPISLSQVQQNYDATKYRFTAVNSSIIKPVQTYGDTNGETFTVTSGYGSESVTLAAITRSGFSWSTSSSSAILSLQNSLNAGTYNDTVTVTDELGQSTYLPIRILVNKADSLTVTMNSATVVTYDTRPITSYPVPSIVGLRGPDSATSVTMFSSLLYTETSTAPTNADTYTVRGAIPTFISGMLDNYLGVIYETSTATINKARQRALNIFLYGGTVGSPYLIYLRGGDGTGAVTETLTGVSSLSGCAISNHYLTASEQKQGFCEVRVVKAGDQNYLAETETAQLYFMAFLNSQPTGLVGSGATIALNGATSLETSTVLPPSITSLSTTSISLSGGGTLTITGTGFSGTFIVKFWRNKELSKTSGSATSFTVSATELQSIGATSGRISVITAAGQAVSVDTLTITP